MSKAVIGFLACLAISAYAIYSPDVLVMPGFDANVNDQWVDLTRATMDYHAVQDGAAILAGSPSLEHAITTAHKMSLQGNNGNGNGNGNGHGHGNDDDDDDDDDNGNHLSGNELKKLGRKFLELQANNTKAIQAVLRLYNTSIEGNCQQYLHALQTGDSHVQELMETVVTPDAKGRIHPLGSFDGPVNLIEYFQLRCVAGRGVDKLMIRKMVAWNDTVHFEFDFQLGTSNLTHIGWAIVHPDGRVCRLKVTFQRLEISDKPVPAYQNRAAAQAAEDAGIQGICAGIQGRCTGANQQYATLADCIAYQQSIPDGGWAKADQQDRACVRLHFILTGIRPDVHCPHVGPTGGNKCVAHTQPSFYAKDEGLMSCSATYPPGI